jgi:hypothetical protein
VENLQPLEQPQPSRSDARHWRDPELLGTLPPSAVAIAWLLDRAAFPGSSDWRRSSKLPADSRTAKLKRCRRRVVLRQPVGVLPRLSGAGASVPGQLAGIGCQLFSLSLCRPLSPAHESSPTMEAASASSDSPSSVISGRSPKRGSAIAKIKSEPFRKQKGEHLSLRAQLCSGARFDGALLKVGQLHGLALGENAWPM